MKAKKLSKSNNKSSIDHLKVSLATQTRVCEMLEQERDRAFDDYEIAQVRVWRWVGLRRGSGSRGSGLCEGRELLSPDFLPTPEMRNMVMS